MKEKKSLFPSILDKFISLNHNSIFRKVFVIVSIIHIIILSLPEEYTNFSIPLDFISRKVLTTLYQIWPLPTFYIGNGDEIIFSRFLCKLFEVMVQLMYVFDLLPKIFNWKQRLEWRLINIIVFVLLFIQIPMTLNFDINLLGNQQRLRLVSISVSFILTCEIISLKEKELYHKTMMNSQSKSDKNSNQVKLNLKTMREKKRFTWAEIIKHDKRDDCWAVINGKVYDLTKFINIHPGGDMILDGAGGECTPMWYSYHQSTTITNGPPAKYYIGDVQDYHDFYSYKSKDTAKKDFYLSLKQKVESVMSRSEYQNHPILFIKAILILMVYVVAQYHFTVYYDLKWCIIYSIVCSQIGVNIMHDGNHLAFSSNKVLSYMAGYTLDLPGSSSVVYRRSHNFGHHGCVNHYELDRAFDTTYPLLRLHPAQKLTSVQKYQHYYVWLIYGTVNFGDLMGTFDELQWMSNYPCRRAHITYKQYILQIVVKLYWITTSMLIPIYYHGYYSVYPIWFAYMFIFSYGYTLFFAVNHWTDIAETTDNSSIGQTEWGILQVINSTNFSVNFKQISDNIMTHVCGGLNYQIEHHLFPYIPHTRYTQITEIIQEHCKEYNVPYSAYPSFYEALKGHYRYMKQLATQQ